jgi:esterase FrsA
MTQTISAADIPPQRTLDELKTEAQARADRNAYPLIGLAPEDVREALSNIHSLDRDEWAAAWSAIGDRHLAAAEAQVATSRAGADANFLRAWRVYSFARWPVPNSPGKEAAYRNALTAFRRHAELLETSLEIVRIPFEGSEIVGYLQLPPGLRPAPMVLAISGLDSRKEDFSERFGWLLPEGIGYIALDSPGTGEAPVKADATAERIYSRVLDYLAARPEVDRSRIACFGASFGGYWATKLAIAERERLVCVAAQSPGVHASFQLSHLKGMIANQEYLFDLIPAAMTIFAGVTTLDALAAAWTRLSLVDQGILGRKMAPMLVIAGVLDSQTPIADIDLLLHSGDTPKDAWINPSGGHMGREKVGWTDVSIFRKVTMPWFVRKLKTKVG